MLSLEQKKEIGRTFVLYGEIDGAKLSPEIAVLMVEDICEYEFGDIMRAFKTHRQNPKSRSWPRAKDLIAIIKNEPDTNDFAVEMSRKIYKAVIEKGYAWEAGFYDPNGNNWICKTGTVLSFKDAVLADLGEVAWHVIQSRGGWQRTCESANGAAEGIFMAQLRDQIKSSYTLMKQGIDVTQIDAPRPKEMSSNVQEIGLRKTTINLPYKDDQ